ncbi:S-adenosylmethionine:tRNA ribosyltransferase-isomerase [Rapidithrix thailandica]|uniref:S-adenosylmethionine:tRNA ribosyltransferase-isomerase n=1 Tax=Rapidithrix thailandica TaxID=413964 RepID=A0AAW9SEH2_9BACT
MQELKLKDFTYHLPEEKIAKYPMANRDASKLLLYRQGEMEHRVFHHLPEILEEGDVLYFNNTKVIPARMHFRKSTGALIEIFLLNPMHPSKVMEEAMQAKKSTEWQCVVGNLKKWKGESLHTTLQINNRLIQFSAFLVDRNKKIVKFTWEEEAISFLDIINHLGETPLPPYLHRESEQADLTTYQTVYGKKEGAVAAPTAGLHFTGKVLEQLQQKGVQLQELTLHVGAGTFQPIKTEEVAQHDMHVEQVVLRRENLLPLVEENKRVVAVGTTSLRTLESTYWFGVKLLKNNGNASFDIAKNDPYNPDWGELPSAAQAMKAVLEYMDHQQCTQLIGHTGIFIYPGYQFRVCEVLITNFHLPASTLILLIAAFVGDDWKKIYEEALKKDYRFLSYGDSSVLFRG